MGEERAVMPLRTLPKRRSPNINEGSWSQQNDMEEQLRLQQKHFAEALAEKDTALATMQATMNKLQQMICTLTSALAANGTISGEVAAYIASEAQNMVQPIQTARFNREERSMWAVDVFVDNLRSCRDGAPLWLRAWFLGHKPRALAL